DGQGPGAGARDRHTVTDVVPGAGREQIHADRSDLLLALGEGDPDAGRLGQPPGVVEEVDVQGVGAGARRVHGQLHAAVGAGRTPSRCCTHPRETPAAPRMTITSRSLAISTQPYEVATRPVGDGTSRTAWMMPVTTRATTEEKASREKRGITAARSPAAVPGR